MDSASLNYSPRNYLKSVIKNTPNQQTEEELRKLVSFLSATLNSTNYGILAVSNRGESAIFNQKLIEMWGIPDEVATSQNWYERLAFIAHQLKEPEAFLSQFGEWERQSKRSNRHWIELQDARVFECCARPQRLDGSIIGRVWNFDDITERVRSEAMLRQQAEREQLIRIIANRVYESVSLAETFSTAATAIREFIDTDRVLIYTFNPDRSGEVVAESLASGWKSILEHRTCEPCFSEDEVQFYQQGRACSTMDIHIDSRITPCYAFLNRFQVRAKLSIPIMQGKDLRGLLLIHHCRGPRQWCNHEIELLQILATQIAIAIQQASLYEQLQAANQELRCLASIDRLTQLANRRKFDESLSQEWLRMAREKTPLSLIMCDIDDFKLYNDDYGHLAGDACLQRVADVLRSVSQRPADLVARYGGEEFAIILPNTDVAGAKRLAEEIRSGIAGLRLVHKRSRVSEYLTFSFGVSSLIPALEVLPKELIRVADEALYRAKANKGNCVVVDSSPEAWAE